MASGDTSPPSLRAQQHFHQMLLCHAALLYCPMSPLLKVNLHTVAAANQSRPLQSWLGPISIRRALSAVAQNGLGRHQHAETRGFTLIGVLKHCAVSGQHYCQRPPPGRRSTRSRSPSVGVPTAIVVRGRTYTIYSSARARGPAVFEQRKNKKLQADLARYAMLTGAAVATFIAVGLR